MVIVLLLVLLLAIWLHYKTILVPINTRSSDTMSNLEFARALKNAYIQYKYDTRNFVRVVPRIPGVDQNAPLCEQLEECGFVNGRHDLKRSIYGSYLVRFDKNYGRSLDRQTLFGFQK